MASLTFSYTPGKGVHARVGGLQNRRRQRGLLEESNIPLPAITMRRGEVFWWRATASSSARFVSLIKCARVP